MQLPPDTRLLTAYRKHWAHRFGVSPFLPMSRAELLKVMRGGSSELLKNMAPPPQKKTA